MRKTTRSAGQRLTLLTLLLAATAAGCDDDPIGPRPEQFEGIWNAVGLVAINAADASEREDLIALGGSMVVSIFFLVWRNDLPMGRFCTIIY